MILTWLSQKARDSVMPAVFFHYATKLYGNYLTGTENGNQKFFWKTLRKFAFIGLLVKNRREKITSFNSSKY